jgi:toxin ParE1/3/4
MTKLIRFAAGVQAELDDAAAWVEADNEGMGLEVLAAVRAAVDRIAERPQTWPLVPHGNDARSYLVKRFRLRVVYADLNHEIRILAVAHTSRAPGYWRERR